VSIPRPRLLSALVLAVAAALAPAIATAQDGRGVFSGTREPVWFASISTGFQLGEYIVDDASSSIWDFDAGFMLRSTIEREVARHVYAGLAFNYARLPLTYTSTGGSGSCARCAADGTISSYGALVRLGGGPGFHQILELFIGALRYGNFEQQTPRGTLPPSSNTDFAFGAGYGFGYTLSRDWSVQLVQDATNALHERSTSQQAGGRLARHFATRLGVRVGF
jgi:hypothetical protein